MLDLPSHVTYLSPRRGKRERRVLTASPSICLLLTEETGETVILIRGQVPSKEGLPARWVARPTITHPYIILISASMSRECILVKRRPDSSHSSVTGAFCWQMEKILPLSALGIFRWTPETLPETNFRNSLLILIYLEPPISPAVPIITLFFRAMRWCQGLLSCLPIYSSSWENSISQSLLSESVPMTQVPLLWSGTYSTWNLAWKPLLPLPHALPLSGWLTYWTPGWPWSHVLNKAKDHCLGLWMTVWRRVAPFPSTLALNYYMKKNSLTL